jgi:signal transduction histidine kinase
MFSPLFGMIQIFLVIALAIVFTYFYCLDHDKRKLMFVIAFLFVSPVYFTWINEELAAVALFEKFNAWSALPIVFAVLVTLLSTFLESVKVETLFKSFLIVVGLSTLFTSVSLFVVNNWGTILISAIASVAIILSIYASVKSKELSNVMFLFSLLSFMAGGLMIGFSYPVGAIFIVHSTAFLFIFLVFFSARKDKNSLSPFHVIQKKLNTANELIKIQEEKLRIMGKLIRHDVRNKLSSILGNIYLAKEALPPDHETVGYLRDTELSIDQIVRIFDFARTYEQLGVEDQRYMNVAKSVKEAAAISDMDNVKLVNDCPDLVVWSDSLLIQLFYNLIDNSLRHGDKVSQIRVHYKEKEDFLKLFYEDNGVGIPTDEKEQIFMEGYGKGTGYGLYLIRKICEAYGWTIQETGKPGKGAQFTITIPETDEDEKLNYSFSDSVEPNLLPQLPT